MINPDTEARTDPQLRLAPRAERGAERAHQYRWRRRFAIVAAALAVLVLGLDGRAWAWTASVQPSTDCKGTTFKVIVGHEPGSHTASLTFDGETKTQTVNAEGGGTITLHFASHDGGPWSYEGTWSESSEVETASGTLPAVTDCEQEETPTPTTAPPVTQPPAEEQPPADKDDEIAGTATDQTRTPPDQHGTPTEEEKKGPPVTRPAPNQLPFTGPQDLLLPAGSLLVFTGALLLVASSRRRYRLLPVAVRAVERALRKPYTGPRERL